MEYDFIIVGAGSAGCAVAAGLSARQAGSVLVIEAGPSDRWPLVRMPFGLVWMMGSRSRDWRYRSTPQPGLRDRQIAVPRGKMVGGSGSINSMVWFCGRRDDFDNWNLPGWRWDDVAQSFDEVEEKIAPVVLATPHPLTRALGSLVGENDNTPPTPEHQSAGVCQFNLHRGRRWSAAGAFLDPAISTGAQLLQNRPVERLVVAKDRVVGVELRDGVMLTARKGVILSAGSIGSPEILLRSGIGPAGDLRSAGIEPLLDAPEVGENLHDHPGCGIHFAGARTGYGLTATQVMNWAFAPFYWALAGKGVFASPTVEGAVFFNADTDRGTPDIQSHFIPFMLGWKGRRFVYGSGFFADAVVCRPRSRGRLSIGKEGVLIDLGIFRDERDLDLLTRGYLKLRKIMAELEIGSGSASEVYPGEQLSSEEQVREHIVAHAATAYHPVGTLRMGEDQGAPVSPRLKFKGIEGLWVADASVMPSVTSANTNAPSMMIGHRAGEMIAKDAA